MEPSRHRDRAAFDGLVLVARERHFDGITGLRRAFGYAPLLGELNRTLDAIGLHHHLVAPLRHFRHGERDLHFARPFLGLGKEASQLPEWWV